MCSINRSSHILSISLISTRPETGCWRSGSPRSLPPGCHDLPTTAKVIDRWPHSGRLAAEIRHGIAQHAEDHRAILARQALLERREPAAHGVERRADRPRRNDAFDPD